MTTITFIEGTVQVMKSGSTWSVASVGMQLQVTDALRTGEASRARVSFFDGSTIELKASTQIEVASLTPSSSGGPTTIQLKQQIGETLSTVTKLVDPASRYEIETPVAVAAVRGSMMGVRVEALGRTTVTNFEGTIVVRAQGIEMNIPVGMSSTVNKGEPPGQPIPTPTLPPTSSAPPTSAPPTSVPPTPTTTAPPPTSTQIPGGVEFTVSAKTGWQQTPVTLKYGEEFYMYFVSGGWTVDARNYPNIGPGGYDTVTDAKVAGGYSGYKVDQTVPYGTLLGRVGTGSVIPVGDKWGPFGEGQSGSIYLRINDTDPTLTDNDGSITVIILTFVPPPFHVTARADRPEVYEGDVITYTYELWNRVDVASVTGVTLKDGWGNSLNLKSGDSNSNSVLDAGERWLFSSTFTTKHADLGKVTNKAAGNGRLSATTSATIYGTAEVTVKPIQIAFTSPGPETVITGPSISSRRHCQ